jgi:hypothetical protein
MINNVLSSFFTPSVVQYYRLEGKINYFVEPIQTKGRLPLNTCSVCIKAYSNKEKTIQIPLKIKWYRFSADRNYEIEELENKEHFDFSAMDIGGEIKASLKPLDDNFKGTVSVIFGPIKFDESLRAPLESVLLSGFSKFNVMVHETEQLNPDKVQPISVFLSPNQIKLFYYSANEEITFWIELTNDKPRLEITPGESESLIIYFDDIGQEEKTAIRAPIYKPCEKNANEKYLLHLKFFSRTSRDIFVTATRLFRIVPVVSLSNLFRQIDVLLRENRLFEGNNKITLNELLVDYDMLRGNLLNTIEYAKELDKDREELQECVTVLERDLEHTMSEFKKYILEESEHHSNPQGQGMKDDRKIAQDAKRKLESLNASLISNRGDMKSIIKQKLDATMPLVADKALNQKEAKESDYTKLEEELERVKKLNAMYLKKIKDMNDYKAKKKESLSKTLREMNNQMSNVSRELGQVKNLREESDLNSKMFDMSGIESKNEDDLFISTPFGPFQAEKKPVRNIMLEEIDEKDERLGFNESKIKDQEIDLLKKKVKDLEKALSERPMTVASTKHTKPEMEQEYKSKVNSLQMEIHKLKSTEAELKEEAGKGLRFIEEFRGLVKKVIAEETSVLLQGSLIDESLMNDVISMNQTTKIKMLDLENDNLKKRVSSLTKEVYLLRDQVKEASMNDTFKRNNSIFQEPDLKDENEELKKENKELETENLNLRDLLERLKSSDNSDDLKEKIEKLKKEISHLSELNQSLLNQRQEASRKMEQMKQGGEKAPEDKREQLIIDQLAKTNARLMEEMVKLQEKIARYDESRQSFISDVNDSFMSNRKDGRF